MNEDKRDKAHGRELTPEEARQVRWRLGVEDKPASVEALQLQVEYLSHHLWLVQEELHWMRERLERHDHINNARIG
jgi:hypothetical protein